MGRPHKPIPPDAPLAQFASGLLALKVDSDLTYRQMAERVTYCVAVLATAAAGRRLPTLEVTLAYVRVCGGSEREWRARWQHARVELDRMIGQGRG